MTCFRPLRAYRSTEKTSGGKAALTFNPLKSHVEGSSFCVPCGRCIGCRIDRSRQWAMRCLHEAKCHGANCFITLTYDQQNVPVDYSVKLRDWQHFMKRLRHSSSEKIRFFACGEYGDQNLRPHYHALLFNYDFTDKKYFTTRNGNRIYKSTTLDEIWGKSSLNEIGDVTFKSAAYCARYVMKKINGDRADDHYTRVSPIDGNVYRVDPEFAVMSRRPGLGADWFAQYQSDAFEVSNVEVNGRKFVRDVQDFIVVDGRRVVPPRFYTDKLSEEDRRAVKRARAAQAAKPQSKFNNSAERLAVREEVQAARLSRLQRKL